VYRILWIQSAGMSTSLRIGLGRLGWPVEVWTTGGSNSVKAKHDAAEVAVERWRRTGQPTVIGHIEDLDAAGLAIVDALAEDVVAL
jgi:hypothetical protein